ncbi:MAG: hypothetical protein JRF41_11725, partial [Deltaproteobacteria bacterium]|nr:hypothetical protein [Deltaproteobacteria bacterium]
IDGTSIAGTLGTGLTLNPAADTTLIFVGGATTISPTGTASTATVSYQFDLIMTIADAATTGRLAGDYEDALNLTLASDD